MIKPFAALALSFALAMPALAQTDPHAGHHPASPAASAPAAGMSMGDTSMMKDGMKEHHAMMHDMMTGRHATHAKKRCASHARHAHHRHCRRAHRH